MKQQDPIKIEIDDLEDEAAKPEGGSPDIAEELRSIGRQFAEAVQSAWNSEERQKLESEVREGFKSFGEELNKVFGEIKTSPAADKVRQEASKIEAGDVAHKAKGAVASGLQWLSQELSKLSEKIDQEAPPADAEPQEKEPPYI